MDEIIDHRYVYETIGYNLKPTELQAAMGLYQLQKLDEIIEKRRNNFLQYQIFFSDYEEYFITPRKHPKADPSWFSFPLTVRKEAPFDRADIINYLEEKKIQTRPLFAGNILRHPAYKDIDYIAVNNLENSDMVLTNSFFIGIQPNLRTEEIEYVKGVFSDYLSGL